MIPVFGYRDHLWIDRQHGFVRRFAVTHSAAHEGPQLGPVLDSGNTARASGRTLPIARRPTSSCSAARPSSCAKPSGKPMPATHAAAARPRPRARSAASFR